jgi:pimeloyl-ACP methyl ester carboxylesterase
LSIGGSAIGFAQLMMTAPGVEQELRGNPVRSLVIRGSEDSSNAAAGYDTLLDLLPNSRGVIIDGAGHYPMITHASTYNRVVCDFLLETT